MFQIKSFTSIVASIVNRMRASTTLITDYNVGSVARTLIEGPAQEIDELYQQMVRGLLEAIPASTYASFEFGLLPPVAATGSIQVVIAAQTSNVLIAAGTSFLRADGAATYTSLADVTIAAGNTTALVSVAATAPGSAGNAAQGMAFTPTPTPAGFISASNLSAIQNGADQETDAQRKIRFGQYVSTLSRGTVPAIAYGLSTTQLTDANGNIIEQVKLKQVVEPFKTDPTQPVALVDCYVHNGVGNTSSALVAQAQNVIYGYYDANGNPVPGYSAAGVNVIISPATEEAIPVSGVITIAPGYDGPTLVGLVQSALATYLLGLDVAQPAFRSVMVALGMNASPGIANFALFSPGADVTPGTGVKLMPGTFALTYSTGVAATLAAELSASTALAAVMTGG